MKVSDLKMILKKISFCLCSVTIEVFILTSSIYVECSNNAQKLLFSKTVARQLCYQYVSSMSYSHT